MSDSPSENESSPALMERDERRIFGNVSLAVLGQATAFAAGLGCMVVTARLLGPKGYGRLTLFFMFLAVLSQVLVGWPNLGLVRFGREELGKSGKLGRTFWARTALFVASLGLAAALLFAFRTPLNEYLQLEYSAAVLLLLYIAVNEGVFLFRGVFQTVSNFRAYAVVTAGVRSLNLLLIVLAFVALAWPVNVAAIIGAHLVSISLIVLLSLTVLPWRRLLPVSLTASDVRRVFKYSWPMMAAGLSVLVVDWVDFVVIKGFRPAAELGWYAASYQPVTVLTALRIAFVSAVLPLFVSIHVEKKHEKLTWFLDEAIPQIAWVSGIGCALAMAAAELIPLILGEKFRPSVAPCQILMPGVAFSVVTALHVTLAQAVDRVRTSVIVIAILAALNVALDLILVPLPRIGILGAGAATTTAFVLSGAVFFPLLNAMPSLKGKSPGRRYVALLAFLPPLAAAIMVTRLPGTATRLVVCAAALAAGVILAKVIGIFRLTTLEKIEGVQMPRLARRIVRKFYGVLGSAGQAGTGNRSDDSDPRD